MQKNNNVVSLFLELENGDATFLLLSNLVWWETLKLDFVSNFGERKHMLALDHACMMSKKGLDFEHLKNDFSRQYCFLK